MMREDFNLARTIKENIILYSEEYQLSRSRPYSRRHKDRSKPTSEVLQSLLQPFKVLLQFLQRI